MVKRMQDCIDPPAVTVGILTPLLQMLPRDIAQQFNTTCDGNCSGHGDCYDGVCFCEVQYSGGKCTDPNLSYYIVFSSIFYMICIISFIQLMVCVKSEFSRMKSPSLLHACRITNQKALYVLICIATAIRGYYFSSPLLKTSTIVQFFVEDFTYQDNIAVQWASSLMSAYYPFLLTGSSLIVCFWAEVFHIQDLCLDKPQFLSKSFLGFLAFNVITYSLLLAELLLLFTDSSANDKSLFTSVINGCYALLMLVVVVFFLIYGVEVFFKVRGSFIHNPTTTTNTSQLHQSRLGLISQAVLQLFTVGFIVSDVLGGFWKDKVPVLSRNFHDIMFRIVEMGVALWFPCVLWNCVRPEQLWILNPRKILERFENEKNYVPEGESESFVPSSNVVEIKTGGSQLLEKVSECWICYDSERNDVGPLIQPCFCKGDVSAVHHDCLKMWLIESAENQENMKCKVCNEEYKLERGNVWLPSGLTPKHWIQNAAIVIIMGSAVGCACLIVRIFNSVGIRTLAVGLALLVNYICLRLLGFSILIAYNRAKFSAVKIMGKNVNEVCLPESVHFTALNCTSSNLVLERLQGIKHTQSK